MNPASPWHWKRYRFMTKAKDYRPIVFNPRFPWWCSGHRSDDAAIIVAYLPSSEPLSKYWDDAFGVEESNSEPEFTGRFSRPAHFVPTSPGDDILATEVRS